MRDKTYLNKLVSFINTELHGEDNEDLFEYIPSINVEDFRRPYYANNYKKVLNYNISAQYYNIIILSTKYF